MVTRFISYIANLSILKRLYLINREANINNFFKKPFVFWKIHKLLLELEIPNHIEVEKLANSLIKSNVSAGYFYLAKSLFLQNKLNDAQNALNILLSNAQKKPDAVYLLSEILVLKGEFESARLLLEDLSNYSNRRKTWQYLSNLVNNHDDFSRFYKLLKVKFPKPDHQQPYDLVCHITNAAVRAKEYDFAIDLWRNFYYELQDNSSTSTKINLKLKKQYTDILASKALDALSDCFLKNKIQFFLISGTLLGCIRENKLLSHDKDIDVGVWDNHPAYELLQLAVRNSGCFYLLPSNNQNIMVIRHVNGITIDVFVHYRSANDYWHAGGKSKWHNTPFTLEERLFLGKPHLIPENFDLYLTENYGSNWRIPSLDFDSALDTPNMEIVNSKEMVIYLYKRICMPHKLSPNLHNRLLQKLNGLGELL